MDLSEFEQVDEIVNYLKGSMVNEVVEHLKNRLKKTAQKRTIRKALMLLKD